MSEWSEYDAERASLDASNPEDGWPHCGCKPTGADGASRTLVHGPLCVYRDKPLSRGEVDLWKSAMAHPAKGTKTPPRAVRAPRTAVPPSRDPEYLDAHSDDEDDVRGRATYEPR